MFFIFFNCDKNEKIIPLTEKEKIELEIKINCFKDYIINEYSN
jgi:hypothetical protein